MDADEQNGVFQTNIWLMQYFKPNTEKQNPELEIPFPQVTWRANVTQEKLKNDFFIDSWVEMQKKFQSVLFKWPFLSAVTSNRGQRARKERGNLCLFSGGKDAIKRTPSRFTAAETLGHVTQPGVTQQRSNWGWGKHVGTWSVMSPTPLSGIWWFWFPGSGAEVQLKLSAVSPEALQPRMRHQASVTKIPLVSLKRYTHVSIRVN